MASTSALYVPRGSHPPPPAISGSVTTLQDAPASDRWGAEGDVVLDLSTGDYYQYTNGAWEQFTPGGAGGLVSAGSPEGVTTGREGQHCWDSVNRIDYIKTSPGTGNTGWEIFLGI